MTKVINIDGWKVEAITDGDGHLTIAINHDDESKVERINNDIARNDTEWSDRFTTELNEEAPFLVLTLPTECDMCTHNKKESMTKLSDILKASAGDADIGATMLVEAESASLPLERIEELCDFSDPNWVWILKGISRNKDNGDNPNMDKFFTRSILTQASDIAESYENMKRRAQDPNTVYRIYLSLNARDVKKTMFGYQKKLIEIGYGLANGQDDALALSKKLDSVWKTQLEQSSSRGTKRFLLDIDDQKDYPAEFMSKLHKEATVRGCVQTVSGWGVVIDACDTRWILPEAKAQGIEMSIQKDSMVFIEQFFGNSG